MDFNKDQIIKYALIALGVYLVYKWASDNGYLAQLTGAAATPQVTPPATPPAVNPPAKSTVPEVVIPSDETLMNAAYYKAHAGDTGDYKLSQYQWNWYRSAMADRLGTKQLNVLDDLTLPIDPPSTPMNAAAYHSLLDKMGADLRGMGMGWGNNRGRAFGHGGGYN